MYERRGFDSRHFHQYQSIGEEPLDIIVKPLPELTKEERRACHDLTLGPEGLMQETLELQYDNPRCYAIMLWQNYLYGWALLEPVNQAWLIEVTTHARRVSKYSAMFYVRESARRRGYGKMLMEEVKKFDPKPLCSPHDQTSGAFFSNYRITATAYRRVYIPKKAKV